MPKLRIAIFEGLIWTTIACVVFVLTYQFDEPLLQYRYGATGWPRALIVAILIFAILQTIWGSLQPSRKRSTDRRGAQVSDSPTKDAVTGISAHLNRILTFGVPLLYLLLMPRTGFYIVTPFFIAGYMMLLGERRLVHLVGTTLLIFVLGLIIFTKLLFVPLPVGNWPGFYDINSLFVSFIK
jgi:hypothetical protein